MTNTTNLSLQKIQDTDYAGNFPTIYNDNLDLIDAAIASKQNKLTAGTGISISNATVENTGVTSINGQSGAVIIDTGGNYTAGNGISISEDNVISINLSRKDGYVFEEVGENAEVFKTYSIQHYEDWSEYRAYIVPGDGSTVGAFTNSYPFICGCPSPGTLEGVSYDYVAHEIRQGFLGVCDLRKYVGKFTGAVNIEYRQVGWNGANANNHVHSTTTTVAMFLTNGIKTSTSSGGSTVYLPYTGNGYAILICKIQVMKST